MTQSVSMIDKKKSIQTSEAKLSNDVNKHPKQMSVLLAEIHDCQITKHAFKSILNINHDIVGIMNLEQSLNFRVNNNKRQQLRYEHIKRIHNTKQPYYMYVTKQGLPMHFMDSTLEKERIQDIALVFVEDKKVCYTFHTENTFIFLIFV